MALRQRLDKWLWLARVAKTRSLATRLVAGGHVRLNAQRIDTPSKGVGPGDVLTIALERQVRVLKVVAPGVRRGGFSEASLLFEELADPRICPQPGPANDPNYKLEHSPAGASEAQSCKNPWTIWTNQTKSNHPHGINQVLHDGRRQGAARVKARFRKVLERP